MAVDLGGLVVKLEADISGLKAGLDQAGNQIKGFSAGTVALGALMASALENLTSTVLHFGVSAVEAYGAQEIALTRLAHLVGHDATQAFLGYAEALQKTTTFSNEDILALESQLAAYGVLPGSIESATHAALEFAAQTGKTAQEAGAVFGQALRGQSRELGSYGLALYQGSTRSENLARVTSFLEDKFHGVAEELKGTTLGAVENLNNRMEDLKKRIGEELVPVVKTWADWLGIVVTKIEELSGAQRNNLSVSELGIQKLREEKDAILEQARGRAAAFDGVVRLTAAEQARLIMITREINASKETKVATDNATKAIQGHTGAIEKDRNAAEERFAQLQKEIRDEAQLYAGITTVIELETQKQVAASMNGFQQQATFSEALAVKVTGDYQTMGHAAVDMASTAMSSFNQATAQVIVEGGRMSDVLKNVFKQILESFISMCLQMIEEWLIVQAVTGGAGGSFGSFIGGLGRHAEGGLVTEPTVFTNLHTGQSGLMGEAGPEAIVPVGAQAPREGGGSSGSNGGGVTVNISGQFLEGSPAKWQALVRGTIMPELRRYAEVNPNSTVIRKRGQA